MAGQFTTTAEEMTAFSAKIVQVNEQVQKEIQSLNGLIGEVAGGWTGDAATAYHQLQQRWNDDAQALNKVLDEIRQAIDATTKQYSATEDNQRSSISGVQGG
ncbi:WXG100 family type VII secretion target [Streptomyces tateyamensis]|uniref:ESAT-6-like protein n=1 Tax=Streptomyces tateyamensis TaxID=565073 RepID=A0A2V4NDU0_9ACTN|nr:WXG100 family type VII secretion target [Streptomyces tateyamensis]PYC81943.1 WXG100 family type VII secretion target [Streptomyces tateyamensis]